MRPRIDDISEVRSQGLADCAVTPGRATRLQYTATVGYFLMRLGRKYTVVNGNETNINYYLYVTILFVSVNLSDDVIIVYVYYRPTVFLFQHNAQNVKASVIK